MENRKSAEKALRILEEKSEKVLELTKKTILEEKICKRGDEALKHYIKKWEDTTRPGVLCLACEAVGGNVEEIIPLQVALLFIAATMDIHDDIIDKSVSKSTGQTLYGKFGEEIALLLGNAFLVKGFNQMYKAIGNLSKERKSLIIDTLKNFLFEVINAHILEIDLRDKKLKIKPEQYLYVLEKKAADIEGRMRIGAIFCGGSSQEIRALSKYGRKTGTLLAIRSDFVDVFEPSELVNRMKYECPPLPILCGLQSNIYRKKIRHILSTENIDRNSINELIAMIYDTAEMSNLKRYLIKLKNDALNTLNPLYTSQAKQNLTLLALSMVEDL